MAYDLHDTIAAIATATGGAARGVVRISGPDAVAKLAQCFTPSPAQIRLEDIREPSRFAGVMHVDVAAGREALNIPGHLLLWPSDRSYTRQPSAEFHTFGSAPLLSALIEQLARHGVRTAAPGEFTLRAFLAGRIDLIQAEAVLGVVDAQGREDLDAALDQLAGGLSRPLRQLREQLLVVLAELEAGLDFVEEDIEFISRGTIKNRLTEAQQLVAGTLQQMTDRDRRGETPRVVIVGRPNAGKSSLFNALLERFGDSGATAAIVSPEPGATRDYVVGRIALKGFACELVDTAGEIETTSDALHAASQDATTQQRRQADLRLRCFEGSPSDMPPFAANNDDDLLVQTKVDLESSAAPVGSHSPHVRCSSRTGAGLDELGRLIHNRLAESPRDGSRGAFAAATANRCTGSLREADRALSAALDLAHFGGDELIAAEIRAALAALGEIVGMVCADDVLDRIFSQFCIGK